MSLLIKALAQAAKDRDVARVEPTGSAASTSSEPAQELTGTPRDTPSLSLEAAAQRRVAPSLAGLAQIEAQQRARAAAVVQAGERAGGLILSYLRASPVALLGGIAALFGIAFGIYVYLQIANPGLLARQPPARTSDTAAAAPPSASPPAVASASPEAPSAAAAPSTVAGASSSAAIAGAGAIPGTAVGAVGPTAAPTPAASASAPIPAASVISRGSEVERPSERAPAPAAERPRERQTGRSVGQQSAASAASGDLAPTPRERIVVSAGSAKPTINPNLNLAYSALQAGDLEQARAMYTRVSQAEPLNIDAQLGLAYIAARENRNDDAMKQYLRILQLDPRHALAQAGMISLMGRADPAAAEARLKQLIAREPSAFLHFILGNLYADQSSWSQAQQAYFQAHHLEPENPDYVYNLAVGLDHLRQTKLALGYYRRAAELAAAQGRANFNLLHARERIGILSSQLE